MQFVAALSRRLSGGLGRRGSALWFCALPAAIGAFALALRLHGLGDKPFWLDEITSLYRATKSLPDLARDAVHNRHYPSYFILLWLVARLGDSQFLLRLPSALCGALAAALAAVIGRKAAGPKSGAAAGLLMALSPFEVQFGQEARSYTLTSALILIALLGLLTLARAPAAAALPWRQEGTPRGAWLAYGLGTAAALSVLNVAIAWLAVANIAAIAIAWRAGPSTGSGGWRAFLRRWGLTQAAVLALWAPSLILVLLFSKSSLANGADWAPAESLRAIWTTLAPVYLLRQSDFIVFNLAPAAVPGLSAAVAAL
ncbi:MAG TPA: glycosyltransferase family 39 protein, partial [Stellaceae bacterium]|nr:glycosyltransferase family 39 protein [Stellaceae bacterium]